MKTALECYSGAVFPFPLTSPVDKITPICYAAEAFGTIADSGYKTV
jgi:hypothetical protein